MKPSIKDLQFLIGRWHTSGEVYKANGSVEFNFKGTDRYEWVAGEKLVLHTTDVLMDEDHVQQIEVIGFDKPGNRYFMQAFEDKGRTSMMYATLTADGKIISTDGFKRANLYAEADKSIMHALWERSDDGIHWKKWMSLTFVKPTDENISKG